MGRSWKVDIQFVFFLVVERSCTRKQGLLLRYKLRCISPRGGFYAIHPILVLSHDKPGHNFSSLERGISLLALPVIDCPYLNWKHVVSISSNQAGYDYVEDHQERMSANDNVVQLVVPAEQLVGRSYKFYTNGNAESSTEYPAK